MAEGKENMPGWGLGRRAWSIMGTQGSQGGRGVGSSPGEAEKDRSHRATCVVWRVAGVRQEAITGSLCVPRKPTGATGECRERTGLVAEEEVKGGRDWGVGEDPGAQQVRPGGDCSLALLVSVKISWDPHPKGTLSSQVPAAPRLPHPTTPHNPASQPM